MTSALLRAAAVLLVCAPIWVPAPSNAQLAAPSPKKTVIKEGLSIQYESQLEYIGDNGKTPEEIVLGEDDNRGIVQQRLSLTQKKGDTDLGGILELRMFPSAPVQAPSYIGLSTENASIYNFDNDARLERIWIHQHATNTDVTLGDLSLTLGKAIAFHVDGNQQGWDAATLRGASLTYQIPGHAVFGAYGGLTNSTNEDPVTRSVLDAETDDTVVALQTRFHFADVFTLGFHGVHIEPKYTNIDNVRADHLWVDEGPGIRISTTGAIMDFRLGGISLYLEGNIQTHDNFRVMGTAPVNNESGIASYGEISWDSGPRLRKVTMVLSAQGIWYRRFLAEGTYRSAYGEYLLASSVRYHQMPTLEPDWVLIRSLGNEAGARIESALRFKRTDTRIKLSANLIQYWGGLNAQGVWQQSKDVTAIHPLLELLQPLGGADDQISLHLGGRYEETDQGEAGHTAAGFLLHGGCRYFTHVNSRHALGASLRVERHRLGVMERNDNFWIGEGEIEYELMSRWKLLARLQYSSELEGDDKHLLVPLRAFSSSPNWFVNGALQYTGNGIFESWSLLIEGGSTRGGTQCHQGSCRVFPDSVQSMLVFQYRL